MVFLSSSTSSRRMNWWLALIPLNVHDPREGACRRWMSECWRWRWWWWLLVACSMCRWMYFGGTDVQRRGTIYLLAHGGSQEMYVNLNFNLLFPTYTITHCIYSVCRYVIERTLQRTIQWSIYNRCHWSDAALLQFNLNWIRFQELTAAAVVIKGRAVYSCPIAVAYY